MRTDTPAYTLGFAALVCIVCSLCVAAAHVLLKERQYLAKTEYVQKTVLLDVTGIMTSANAAGRDRDEVFASRIRARLVDLATGEYVESPDIDPLRYDQRRARNDPARSRPAPDNASEITRIPHLALVYIALNESGESEQIVLPIEGNGLYGMIYGFLALERDANTVRGIAFHELSETPGLGSLIAGAKWRAQWVGRKVYDEEGSVAIEVIKQGGGPPETDPHRVNAITGASISGYAIEDMLGFWMGESGFGPFITRLREQGL